MRVSLRRNLRVGEMAGTLVEDYGVTANKRHKMTLNDLLNDNADLLERAAELLVSRPVYHLDVTQTSGTGGAVTLVIEASANLESADVYVDGRPYRTVMLAGEPERVTLTGSPEDRAVKVQAFDGGQVAAARTLTVPKVAGDADGFG
jgi:hypothetical protein